MKKVGIVTFHRARNYGAVLQAYALQKYIEGCGVSADVVDYRNDWLTNQYTLPDFFSVIKKRKIRSILNYFPVLQREKNFETFRKQFLKTSSTYTEQTILNANEVYDAFFFGSDQIWNGNLSGGDMNYLGAFIEDEKKLFSYAASFGNYMPADSEKENYQHYLGRFQKLSVREQSGADILKELTNAHYTRVVLDPVFLLSEEDWKSITATPKFRKPYIFLYTLQGKKTNLMETALYLSKKINMPVVEMQAWVNKKHPRVRPRFCDDPIDFLTWIKDAAYVVTDSFHCTAFSVIFKKRFWSSVVETKDPKDSRIGNLLFTLGLEDRLLPADKSMWNYDRGICYQNGDKILAQLTTESKKFLQDIFT